MSAFVVSTPTTAIAKQLFAGCTFAILTRLPDSDTILTLIHKSGGHVSRTATAADASYMIGLAEENALATGDTDILAAFAGRVHRLQLITESVRRRKLQPLQNYLISPPKVNANANAWKPGVYSHQTTSVIAHSSVTAASAAAAPAPAPSPSVRPPPSIASADIPLTASPAAASPSRAARAVSPIFTAPMSAPLATAPSLAAPLSKEKRRFGGSGTKRPRDAAPREAGQEEEEEEEEVQSSQPRSAQKFREHLARQVNSPQLSESIGLSLSQPGAAGAPAATTVAHAAEPTSTPDSLPALEAPSLGADPQSTRIIQSLLSGRKRRKALEATQAQAEIENQAQLRKTAVAVDMVDSEKQEHKYDSQAQEIEIPATNSEEQMEDVLAEGEVSATSDRARRIEEAVQQLEASGFAREVILHALLVTSGRMQHARQYLLGSLPPSVHVWHPSEDSAFSDHAKTKEAVRTLGKELCAERCAFLHVQ